MQWDIGYGKFSGGLNYRPKLEISYTLEESTIELLSQNEFTIAHDEVIENRLEVGFSKDGHRNIGCFEFDLTQIPDVDNTITSVMYVQMQVNNKLAKANLRFHLELVRQKSQTKDYEAFKNRDVVERIGYEVSSEDIEQNPMQRFIFDSYTIKELLENSSKDDKFYFVMYATSQKQLCQNQNVHWLDIKRADRPKLIIKYIKKRRNGVGEVSDFKFFKEDSKIKLTWKNPTDEAFRGVIVVKNRFHVPSSPYDGQKLYGGRDNYTYDSFGATDINKYYAVFTYDDVPNFSEATSIFYRGE